MVKVVVVVFVHYLLATDRKVVVVVVLVGVMHLLLAGGDTLPAGGVGGDRVGEARCSMAAIVHQYPVSFTLLLLCK